MHKPLSFAGMLLLLVFIPMVARGQETPPDFVRLTRTHELEGYAFLGGDSIPSLVWSSQSLQLSGGMGLSPRPEFTTGDLDGDGIAELAVIDPFGITVLGDNPRYWPFDTASTGENQVVFEDLDGDGRPEVITQRKDFNIWPAPKSRTLSVWMTEPDGLQLSWRESLPGMSYVLLAEDVDEDGAPEILTASESIALFDSQDGGRSWEISAELPNIGIEHDRFTLVDVVRVADVDDDGVPEILATGNSGRLTVYMHAVRNERTWYPVVWQSDVLVADGTRATDYGTPAHAFTQGLEVADFDGDGTLEILVGTVEFGQHPDNPTRGRRGRVLQFEPNERGGFRETWRSEWVMSASIPGIRMLTGPESDNSRWIHNGGVIYGPSGDRSGYLVVDSLDSPGRDVVASESFATLDEPLEATRIVPEGWSLPRLVSPDDTLEFTVSFKNVWAPAGDVSIRLESLDPALTVMEGKASVTSIGSGETVELGPFRIRTGVPNETPSWEASTATWYGLEGLCHVTAAGGYRQAIPFIIMLEERN